MNSSNIINDIVQRSIEIVSGHTQNMTATEVSLNTLNVQRDLQYAREKRLPVVIHYAFPGRVCQIQPYQLAILLSVIP